MIDVESITSEKITVMFDAILTDPAELAGEVEMTVGAVESITIVLEPDDDQLPAASRSWT